MKTFLCPWQVLEFCLSEVVRTMVIDSACGSIVNCLVFQKLLSKLVYVWNRKQTDFFFLLIGKTIHTSQIKLFCFSLAFGPGWYLSSQEKPRWLGTDSRKFKTIIVCQFLSLFFPVSRSMLLQSIIQLMGVQTIAENVRSLLLKKGMLIKKKKNSYYVHNVTY